ncbi:MAG: alpha-1,2-fucosyltransferase, partial [Pseudomonadota bacterium]|nr:alpha-1,2-fucosyltransferase [Pseudomonadota bacterium]
MCLMSMCTGFIIANSTFSWWPAWLSEAEDKTVVYPKQWFGITGYTKDHDVSDLFPRRWVKI